MAFLLCLGAFKQWKGPSTGRGAPDMWKQGRQGARSQAYLSFNSFWILPLPRFYHFSSSYKKSSLCTFQPYITAWLQLLLTRSSVMAMVWKTKKPSNNYGESPKTNLCYWIEAGHGVFYKLHWLSVSNARTQYSVN